MLALYRCPKKFLEDLEKEVLTLREKLALVSVCQLICVTTLDGCVMTLIVLCVVLQKKQVEIKEVNVKKTGTVVSSNTGKLLLHVRGGSSVSSCLIGASLSEPHTSVTSLRTCVCMFACLDRPLTVNFK